MRNLMTLAVVLVFAGLTQAADAKADVKAVLDDQVNCWNKGDLDGFLKTYWNDDALTFYSGGTTTKGWKNVAERYKKNYAAPGKAMGKLKFEDLEISLIDDKNALVLGKWNVNVNNEETKGLYTLIVRKTDAGWKIVHDHTSK